MPRTPAPAIKEGPNTNGTGWGRNPNPCLTPHERVTFMEAKTSLLGRPLTTTEQKFFLVTENERQAIEFAKVVPSLPENCSHEYITNVVMLILCAAKEVADREPTRVQYLGGWRRDIWRKQ